MGKDGLRIPHGCLRRGARRVCAIQSTDLCSGGDTVRILRQQESQFFASSRCRAGLLLAVLLLLCGAVHAQVPPFRLPPAPPVNLRVPPLSPGSGFGFFQPPQAPSGWLTTLSERADSLTKRIAEEYSFCIVDSIKDRNDAFDFSRDPSFVDRCYRKYNDAGSRLCGEAELQAYIKAIPNPAFPPFNSNCNHTHWSLGCEPGWSASTSDPETDSATPAEDPGGTRFPLRVFDPQPCCEGFFCPKGLTCMIPCPLGAYCPLAWYWEEGGFCLPYAYQLSPPYGNRSCGGADMWGGVSNTAGIFCAGGNYCPSTTEKLECEAGHYCRQGSTEQSTCSRLTKCDAKQAEENLHGYGFLLMVMLALVLLLIYNCSDHVMHVRERRRAKARETAARQARDYISAGERWKSIAKRRAKNFSGQLTRTFSRRKSAKLTDSPDLENRNFKSAVAAVKSRELSMLAAETINEDEDFSSTTNLSDIYALEFQADNNEDLYPSIEAPPVVVPNDDQMSSRVATPSPVLGHSRSQIFQYAYGQIERERFSLMNVLGQKDYADMLKGSRRPPIELAFEDLCLILKGSGKKILSNVTGKLSPGRITAVMGPSGAGKTTFLNALAGKTTHSYTTGFVRINGQPGTIQAYKRIIGFVPQDDIVHGSLTVEENLWFSAKYRLPVNMAKREKVFVVERIISALDLGNIRDSRVGTVEKRGISGGQRKRVNVGLEMVMEPSLLILDEPTSGLDSTSSRLVLQALRREALVGVNVAVVLHQPSYGLFRMFDDVMFLAKGGRTVYLGPVADVEEYFSDLGITVPERINPPDHFLDIIEGVAKPDGDANFDQSCLPVLWMTHNGYRIPEDLQGLVPDATPSKRSKLQETQGIVEKTTSLTHELYLELKTYLVVHMDIFKSAFVKVEDQSGRRTPGFFHQFDIILRRVALQRFREARFQAQDYIILLLAGATLGFLSDVKDTNLGSTGYTYTIMAISLLCMISALRTFSADKLQFWRESASGINRYAFFLAKDTVDIFNVAIKPLVYLALFYFFNDPRSTFLWNFIVTLALVYCVTGIGYIFAVVLQPAPAQLWSVFVGIIGTLLATKSTGYFRYIAYGSYARWALEAYVIVNAERYSGVWLITRCQVLYKGKYRIDHLPLCLGILFGYGALARIIALFFLVMTNRHRQK